jgi:hypothetical protein
MISWAFIIASCRGLPVLIVGQGSGGKGNLDQGMPDKGWPGLPMTAFFGIRRSRTAYRTYEQQTGDPTSCANAGDIERKRNFDIAVR